LPVRRSKMENQENTRILEIEGKILRETTKHSLRLEELSNLVLRSSSFLVNNLIDVNHQLVFTISHDGELIPAIYESDKSLVTKPVRFIKARPALFIEFPQRNEALRREMFEKPRSIDYLGNDVAKLKEIARNGDFKCKYRMQTLIDELDDLISFHLGRNLYSTSLEKRPRINLDQLRELWAIIPHKAVHLANVISFGSSLILHRRSQRLNSMARNAMSRIERLFYYHPLISDGYYPFSFEPEKELNFIDFIMNESGPGEILKSHQKTVFTHYWSEFNKLQTVYVPPAVIPGLTVSENLNSFDRKRFRVERKDPESLGDLLMPGNPAQKKFLRGQWNVIKQWPIPTLKALLIPGRVNTHPDPGSAGFLSKIGRLRVKRNLRILYKYYEYVNYHLHKDPLSQQWIFECQETLSSIHVNLLLWQTNSIKPFRS